VATPTTSAPAVDRSDAAATCMGRAMLSEEIVCRLRKLFSGA
jgi:hypothetical protein